jgi:hypothetical protein
LVDPLASVPSEEDDIVYSVLGFNGTTITHIFHWRHLSNVLADGVSGVLPVADKYLAAPDDLPSMPGGRNPTESNGTPSLFTSEGPDADTGTDVVGSDAERGVNFDPIVLAGIDLPVVSGSDYLAYYFYYDEYDELVKTVYPTGAYDRVTCAPLAAIGDVKQSYARVFHLFTRNLFGSGHDHLYRSGFVGDHCQAGGCDDYSALPGCEF